MFDCILNVSADWANFVVAFCALIVSFAALGVAWWSARLAKEAAQAQLVTPFLNEYASEKMLNALKLLKRWKENNPDLLKDISALRHGSESDVDRRVNSAERAVSDHEIDEARRLVDLYFKRAYKLWKFKLIDNNAMRCIIDNEAYHGLFFQVVTPLTLAVGLIRIWCELQP